MNYRLFCVGNDQIDPRFTDEIKKVLQNHHVEESYTPNTATFTFASMSDVNWPALAANLVPVTERYRVDFSFHKVPASFENVKLMIFDMDSTLVDAEVIDEMGKVLGIGEKIAGITDRAMKGELNFDQSLRERVALLKGMPESAMEEIESRIKLHRGVPELMKKAQVFGIKTAIVTGGFTYFASSLKEKLGMDYFRANELEFSDGKLTGNVLGTIVNAEGKAKFLEELRLQLGLSASQVVAVGDGANDLLMLNNAGMGVAWHAKEKVKQSVSHHCTFGPMTHLLKFLGHV